MSIFGQMSDMSFTSILQTVFDMSTFVIQSQTFSHESVISISHAMSSISRQILLHLFVAFALVSDILFP